MDLCVILLRVIYVENEKNKCEIRIKISQNTP